MERMGDTTRFRRFGNVRAWLRVWAALAVASFYGCVTDSRSADAASEGSNVQTPEWTLSEVPEFSVSESTDPPAFQLHMARRAVILEDGSIVLGNVGSLGLIYFSSDGRARRIAGGAGSGPGEFLTMSALFPAGEFVGVWDQRSTRLTLFSSLGELVGVVSFQDRRALPVGALGGEGVVTKPYATRAEPAVPGEPRRYRLWTDSGELLRELEGPVEPDEIYLRYSYPNQAGGLVSAETQLDAGCVARLTEVVVGAELYILDPGAGTVSAVDAMGSARQVYRTEARRPITEDMRETMQRAFALPGRPPPDDSVESVFRRMGEVGNRLPAWRSAVPDPSGRLWLELARCMEQGPASYEVIDSDGALLARATIPAELALLAVRDDRVLVARRDELGVEHLELYRIRSGPNGGSPR